MNRALTRVALVFCVLLGSPLWARAVSRRLVAVDLHEEAGRHWLSIKADRPPNFTSFKLSHPSRVVVDFPETAAAPVKQVGPADGLIAGWSVQPLGSDNQVVARLTVELRKDADYTLTSTGNAVELRLLSTLSRPLVALENEHVRLTSPPDSVSAPSVVEPVAVAAPPPPSTPAVTVAPPPVVPAPPPATEVTPPVVAQVTPPPLVMPVTPPISAADKARLAREARLAAVAEKRRVEEEKRRQAIADAKAKQEAYLNAIKEKKARAAERLRQQEAARLAALAQQREKVAAARRQKLAAAQAQADKVAAQKREHEAALRAKREQAQEAVRARAEEARLAREREAEDRRQKLAAAEELRRAHEAEEAASPEPTEEKRPATFGQMGFRRLGSVAEVLLHTSRPVTYAMREGAGGKVVLILEHTRIFVANNGRSLDTSYFGTPVARIVPHDNARDNRVEVEFDLASPVPYEIKADGGSLTVLFRSPPVVRAEADPTPGMTPEP